ncbi:hypothetical protein [Magnetospirillum sp. SS-4]|uniref:hypothetical protein n=1 Tax=Magnetospirillum sp. SS-4 TaxID=2681465 RepID=UPI0013816185|nr:hypothetical protein [Magnetospirillum sp. SS-4]CAA7617377.1 hypothetical protein MTBSS4_190007 [Magnetospirillum sp. SS-4]
MFCLLEGATGSTSGLNVVLGDQSGGTEYSHRIGTHGAADFDKLDDIQATFTALEFRHERLRLTQSLGQVRLQNLPFLASGDQGGKRLLILFRVRRFHGLASEPTYLPVAHTPTWDIIV